MHYRQALRLRQQWQRLVHPICSHPQYEAETVFTVPTGEYLCTHCGKVLTDLERAFLSVPQERPVNRGNFFF